MSIVSTVQLLICHCSRIRAVHAEWDIAPCLYGARIHSLGRSSASLDSLIPILGSDQENGHLQTGLPDDYSRLYDDVNVQVKSLLHNYGENQKAEAQGAVVTVPGEDKSTTETIRKTEITPAGGGCASSQPATRWCIPFEDIFIPAFDFEQ